MHTQCKRVYANVAQLLRDIQADETINPAIRERAKLVGTQVIYAGYRIIDMEIDTQLAGKDGYKRG